MNKWDALAKRCYVSRLFIKRTAYMIWLLGDVDPWVRHIFMQEAANMLAPEWAVISKERENDTERVVYQSATRSRLGPDSNQDKI